MRYINPRNYDTEADFWEAVEREADRYDDACQAADDACSEPEDDNA